MTEQHCLTRRWSDPDRAFSEWHWLTVLVKRDSQYHPGDCRNCGNNASPDTATRKRGVINSHSQGL